MIFLLGFRTPNVDEVPEILYIGNDGDAVQRIADASKHPRLARMVNPQLYSIRHWSEEAAAAFEASKTPTPSNEPSSTAAPEQSGESAGKVPGAASDSGTGAQEGVDTSAVATAPAAEPAPSETAAESAGPTLTAPEAPRQRGRK